MEQSDIVALLTVYGFSGLTLLTFDPSTHTSNYKFTGINDSKLNKLGEPEFTSNGKVAVYKVGADGKLGYCPSKYLVRFIYKGKARDNKTAYDAKGSRIPTTPDIEQAFYKAQASASKQNAFVKKVWLWANQHFFSSQMGLPEISVGPACAFAPKLKNAYGVFQYSRATKHGKMFIHTKCFKATEQIAVGTIIHEMCHQATNEIDHITPEQSRFEQGHGPEWKKWMVHCNLEPNRYAYEDLVEYGDAADRIAQDEKFTKLVGPKCTPQDFHGLTQIHSYTPGQIVMFDYKGHLARGYVQSGQSKFFTLDAKGRSAGVMDPPLLSKTKVYLAPSQKQALT